jgi:CubicO group peptidase (beta-lactamase class C family)
MLCSTDAATVFGGSFFRSLRVSGMRRFIFPLHAMLLAGLISGIASSVALAQPLAQPLGMESNPTDLAKTALGTERGVATVGVWRKDEAFYGMASNANPVITDAGTPPDKILFEIASISKVFTGLLLAQAVERGDFSLDDTLGKLLPAGTHFASPAVAHITLRQIVTHRSCLPALPAGFDRESPANYLRYDRQKLFDAVSTLQLPQPPPCEPVYSNFGFAILGELLSERYGKSWEELVRERIAGPLGMTDTAQHVEDKAQRLALPFRGDKLLLQRQMLAFAGAAGLYSTAADMLIFSRAILAGKNGPLGEAAERLVTPLAIYQEGRIGYAVMIRGPVSHPVYTHDGVLGGYRSRWIVAPDTGEAMIVFASNEDSPIDEVRKAVRASRALARGEVPVP